MENIKKLQYVVGANNKRIFVPFFLLDDLQQKMYSSSDTQYLFNQTTPIVIAPSIITKLLSEPTWSNSNIDNLKKQSINLTIHCRWFVQGSPEFSFFFFPFGHFEDSFILASIILSIRTNSRFKNTTIEERVHSGFTSDWFVKSSFSDAFEGWRTNLTVNNR